MTEPALNIVVELRPHIGKKQTPLGVIDVEHNQWIVMVGRNGDQKKQVGYLAHRDGSQVLWLNGEQERYGKWLCGEIQKEVDAERARITGAAPTFTEAT